MTAPNLIRCQCGEMLIDDGGNSHYEGTTWLHYLEPGEPASTGGESPPVGAQVVAGQRRARGGNRSPSPVPERSEPRLIVLPWDVLASSNKLDTAYYDSRRKAYKDALEAARAKVAVQVQAQGWEPFTGPVAVLMEYYPPDRRRRDCSNLDKLAMDALEGPADIPGVYLDDVQAEDWRGVKYPPDPDDPRVVITVRALDEERRGAA